MNRRSPFHSNAVWPPPFTVGLFIFIYGVVAGSLWLTSLAVPNRDRQQFRDSAEIGNIQVMMLGLVVQAAAGAFAGYRLVRFHPACNKAYAAWLKLSPWTAAKPLPLGPVHFVWQDVAVVGALTALAYYHAHVDPVMPVMIFGLVYLGGMTLLIAVTRRWCHCLALGFLWPALALQASKGGGNAGLAIIAAIILVVWHGHVRSLKAFPWQFLENPGGNAGVGLNVTIPTDPVNGTSAAGTQANLGWPYMALSPKARPCSVPWRVNLSLSVLSGWWCYCAIVAAKMDPLPELILCFAILAALFRLGLYGSGTAPPINILGRIASGRFIVPGYDKIFLTPLAVVLTAILGVILVKRSGAWYPAAESCVLAVIWYVLFGGGPTLRSWVLTGQVRLRPPPRQNTNRQTLRPV